MSRYWIVILCFLVLSCSDKGVEEFDVSNLEIQIDIDEMQSGLVSISANAENTTDYHFFVGDGETEPHVNQSGYFEYTYSVTGLYSIEVRAYGVSGRYLTKTKQVFVDGEEAVEIGIGYSTPLSYPGMDLVWNDEFNGNDLNQNFWSYDNGDGCPNLCGWGNNELEFYRPENSWVNGGVFTIEAREESFQGSEYTSTKIVTRDKIGVDLGRVDIRAQLPKGQGIWPALWMLGTNHASVGWPKCGEIDIMEMIGGSNRENHITGNAFWDQNGVANMPSGYSLNSGTFADEFHVFTIIRDKDQIQYFVDDNHFHTIDITSESKSELRGIFYVIFNVAVGGNWPGSPDETTVFPTQMHVDYIRVFEDQ